jgi:endonuclease/exonuclease/phosphatase family metal-dependent hydrolase
MKILFYNIAYGAGLNGSLKQYFFNLLRFFWLPINKAAEIVKFLKEQDADVICLAEVDGGSLRNRLMSQPKRWAKKMGFDFYYTKCKYHPKSVYYHIPIFRKRNDAVISRKNGRIFYHYLYSGMKKLVQEFVVDNISIFTVHLNALSSQIRKMQLIELGDLLKICPRPFVLCGDFNIFKGLEELDSFIQSNDLRLTKTPPTFPSINPKKHFDLFLTSPGVKIKDAGVINVQYSDHLPVWIKIENI